MNKKLILFASLCVVLCTFNACEEPLSQNKYEDNTKLWPAADSIGEKVGYINEKGEMVIPPQYKDAFFFCNGMAKVITFDDKTQFIDTKGNVVYTLSENERCDNYFYNGYLRYHKRSFVWEYGLYDSNFNPVLPFEQMTVGNMSKEGLVATGLGYYNKKGERVLTFNADTFDIYNSTIYDYGDFCDGVAVVYLTCTKNAISYRRVCAIDTKGEWVVDTIYYDLKSIGNGLLAYVDSTLHWGLMDTHGNKVTEPMFHEVKVFEDDDLLPVLPVGNEHGKWGYVDKTGTMRIEPKFSDCVPFHEGVAWAWNENKEFFLIDTQGNILINFGQYVNPGTCSHNGLIGVEEIDLINKRNVFKYIDKNNNTIYNGWTIYSWEQNEGRNFTPHLWLPSRVPSMTNNNPQNEPNEQ